MIKSKTIMVSDRRLRRAFHIDNAMCCVFAVARKHRYSVCCPTTGVKLYPVRGGLWRVSGYAWDGSDVQRFMDKVKI